MHLVSLGIGGPYPSFYSDTTCAGERTAEHIRACLSGEAGSLTTSARRTDGLPDQIQAFLLSLSVEEVNAVESRISLTP